MAVDCKDLVEAGDLLRQRQITANDRLRHEHQKLTALEALSTNQRKLDESILMHGRAVRQSVQLQDQADEELRKGNVKEAERLMELALQACPDPDKLPAAPADAADKAESRPAPDKGKEPAPAPTPAPPAPEQPADKAAHAPKEKGAHAAPEPSPAPDSSGLEERLKAHFDQGFGLLRAQVEQHALPDGYREVLEEFSPEDLRTALRAGRWVNKKRGNPFKKSDTSEPPHNNGVAEDGNPHH